MINRIVLLTCLLVGVAACGSIERVEVDRSAVVREAVVDVKLACAYRLDSIEDARIDGEHAGALGWKLYRVEDVSSMVRDSLMPLGFQPAGGEGKRLDLRVMKLYVDAVNVTKIPVAVYEISIDKGVPFLVRGQVPSMNWKGSKDEAMEAYADAVREANRQLVLRLNAGCERAK